MALPMVTRPRAAHAAVIPADHLAPRCGNKSISSIMFGFACNSFGHLCRTQNQPYSVIDRDSIGLAPAAAPAWPASGYRKKITDYFTSAATGAGTVRPARAGTALPAGALRPCARIVTPEFSSHYIKYQCCLIAFYR
ncbi:hypothetical protein [Burkholderia plantarii]|uniref:hypothetical protein n=1 Tax=Burkholderia plantarii TaxID=41899 RepID=UPI0011E028E5|nr:hypothetical protein [Burkholderia plantarii]